jgi:acetoin utilization protein AcuB
MPEGGKIMYVRNLMSQPVISVTTDMGAGVALQTMREKIIRRLPIVDHEGRLVGIVNDRSLLRLLAEPRRHRSDPMPTVGRVMSSPVTTVPPDLPLEEAASLMADKRVGALLVVENEKPVGILTDRDLYRVFFDLLGGRDAGLRVTLRAPANVDILADVAIAISNAGGALRSFGSITHEDESLMVLKVKYINEDELQLLLRDFSVEIESIRQV